MIWSDLILHDTFGEIFIFWDESSRVVECTPESSHREYYAAPGSAQDAIPAIYDYLKNYGAFDAPPFPFEALNFGTSSKFTVDVYQALFNVPKGALITYAELAYKAGRPRAYRAAGTAMRKNRHMLLLPCHRVIGADNLGNFAAGMQHKIQLMEMEGHKDFLRKFPQYWENT